MSLNSEKSFIEQDVITQAKNVISRSKDITDTDKLLQINAEEMTTLLIKTISRLQLTIGPSTITTLGTGYSGFQVNSQNIVPIVIDDGVS